MPYWCLLVNILWVNRWKTFSWTLKYLQRKILPKISRNSSWKLLLSSTSVLQIEKFSQKRTCKWSYFPYKKCYLCYTFKMVFFGWSRWKVPFCPSSFLKSMAIKRIWLEKLHFQYWFKPNNFRMELGMIRQWNLPKHMSHRLISKVIKVRHHLSTKPISWRRRVEGVRGCFVNEIGFRKWILCKHFRKATFSEILDIGSYKRNSKWLMYGFFYYSWLFSYAGKFWTKARKMLFASSLKL